MHAAPSGASAGVSGPQRPTPGSSPRAHRPGGARGPGWGRPSTGAPEAAAPGFTRGLVGARRNPFPQPKWSPRAGSAPDRPGPPDLGRETRSSPALNRGRGNEARGASPQLPLGPAAGQGGEPVPGFPWGNASSRRRPHRPRPARPGPAQREPQLRPAPPSARGDRYLHWGCRPGRSDTASWD